MNTVSASNFTIDPPRRDEGCEKGNCPAPSVVAVLLTFDGSKIGRLTFCGHHFDEIDPTYRAQAFKVIADARATVG